MVSSLEVWLVWCADGARQTQEVILLRACVFLGIVPNDEKRSGLELGRTRIQLISAISAG